MGFSVVGFRGGVTDAKCACARVPPVPIKRALSTVCPLCNHSYPSFVCEDKRRPFYVCSRCELVFVPESYWLTEDEERARYALHDNTIDNDGYVKYLSQVADVVKDSFEPYVKILDYGCGENAVLRKLLTDVGFDCVPYDPLYFQHSKDFLDAGNQFDVIILCEVVEHIRDIKKESALINMLLNNDGGTIIVRTQIYSDLSAFPKWWYAQDPTHISFFNKKALNNFAASLCRESVIATEYPDIFIMT